MTTVSEPPISAKTYRCGTLSYTKRGLIALFAWMLWGDFCFTMMEAVVPNILPLKLHSLNPPDTIISLVMTTLPAIFNFTITPAVSFKSDRLRSRWGRRLPFILATMPFLVISLALIGFSDDIGAWVHRRFFAGSSFDQTKVLILLLCVFAAAFNLFNMFVNTIYWYLFNDVVPTEMMGRFVSWFRGVSTLTTMLFFFLVFPYAQSHMKAIFLGAALLYLVGFGLVCLRIKEGEYPPLDDAGRQPSFIANLKTFASECFTLRYYWDIFLEPSFYCLGGCIGIFGVFFNQSLGLNLANIGNMNGLYMGAMAICFFFVGSLLDRWHPVRASAYLGAFSAFFCLGAWIWLFIPTPNPVLYLWLSVISGGLFNAGVKSVSDAAGMARLMKLLPHERFGQFSGALCLVRAVAIIIGGILAGTFMDLCRRFLPQPAEGDPDHLFVYRYMFVFSGSMTIIAFYFHYRVYRSWKRLGGDRAYVPPAAGFSVRALPPRADDDGKVHRGLLWVAAIGFAGNLLTSITWIVYYAHFKPNMHYATMFAIAAGVNVVLFLAYLRFVKFMERP